MNLSRLLMAGALALTLVACSGQAGLGRRHARFHEPVFRAQRAHPEPAAAKKRPPPLGLDSQEAAIVAKTYVQSLAPAKTRVEEPPVLIVSPPADQRGAPARSRP